MEFLINTFDIYKVCFPLLVVKKEGDNTSKRFVGSSIILDSNQNSILSCSHIYDSLESDEELGIYINDHKKTYKLTNIKKHNKIDLMTASVEIEQQIICLSDFNSSLSIYKQKIKQLCLGMQVDIISYYNDPSNKLGTEMRSGIISRINTNNSDVQNLGAYSRHELSFSVPNGFSGSPVLLKYENITNSTTSTQFIPIIIGIVFNHVESRISQYEHRSIEENNTVFKESIFKVQENALMHSLTDINDCLCSDKWLLM